MYRRDVEERMACITVTERDLLDEMKLQDEQETAAGRNFLANEVYKAKEARVRALETERMKLLRELTGE
jgi:hypothetical protein